MDSKQLVIMKRLCVLLEGVTPSNGYDFDLTGRVFRGKSVFGASESLPFLSILESLRPDAQPGEVSYENMLREEEWDVLVQGWAITSQTHPTDELYGLKAAMEHRLSRMIKMDSETGQALFPEDYRLRSVAAPRGLITGARIGPGVVRAATPQTGGTEAVYLPVTIRYIANVSDPWALS